MDKLHQFLLMPQLLQVDMLLPLQHQEAMDHHQVVTHQHLSTITLDQEVMVEVFHQPQVCQHQLLLLLLVLESLLQLLHHQLALEFLHQFPWVALPEAVDTLFPLLPTI